MARRLASSLLVLAALLAIGEARARAAGFDPFRPDGAASRAPSLNPIRVADDQPAAPKPKKRKAPAPPTVCQVDEDCPAENICEDNRCQRIQISTNILYLYYREGSFTEILGLYWARRGSTGYTVLAPFWWHFWSPQSQFWGLAPFYWRSEDYARQSVTTVIVPGLPVSWSHEPGARSFGVWPIFYASTKFGWAVPFLGTFHIKDPDAGRSAGAVAYLYWWRRSPGHTFDLFFPLFVTTTGPNNDAFTYMVPFNFAWSHGKDEYELVVPLGYRHTFAKGETSYTLIGYFKRNGPRYGGSVAWLYWFERDHGKAHSAYDVLFPLIWDFRAPKSRSSVVFPLFWHFRTGADSTTIGFPLVWSFDSPDSNTTIAANYVHVRRGDMRFDTFFPLWWSGSDKGGAFQALIPFFYRERSANGHQATWVSAIGGYSRDDDAHATTLALLPFFFHHADPKVDVKVMSPFYISHRSFPEHSRTRLSLLLFYQRRDDRGATSVVFPLWWHFRSEPAGATASAFLGFYAHRRGPRDESTFVGPFPVLGVYWRNFTGGGWSAGLFPLAYFGENQDREHGVIFPVYWHFASKTEHTTVVAPIYYWHRDATGYTGGVLPFLTFFGKTKDDSYAFQIPFYWRFANERQGWSTTATLFGYVHTDSDGWSFGVGPVLPLFYYRAGTDRSHTVLFPLFWHFRDRTTDTATTVVLLYFHRTRGEETTDGVFPFFSYRRGARPGGTDETSFTLFPLVHYRRDAVTRRLLTPLYSYGYGPRRAAGFTLLYFWYRDASITAGLVPFLYADVTRKATGERTRQWGPYFQIDGPGRRSRVLFPLWGRYEDAKEQDTYVFPSYFRQRKTDGTEIDALFPLFFRSSWGGRTTTVVGLWYDHTKPGVHDTGLVPIYFHARNEKTSTTIVPPLLLVRHHDFTTDRRWTWLALFWHSSERDATTTTLFPVLWYARKGPKSHLIFFPLFWRYADESTQSESNLVAIFYWSSWGAGRTRGIMPLAWYTVNPAAGTSSAGFIPVFYWSTGRDRSALFTLLGGYRRQTLSHMWYALLGLVLFSEKVESTYGMVAPFWFSHTDKITEKKITVMPVPFYVSISTPDTGITTCCLLFWRHHDIGSSTTFGFPLYYDLNDYNVSRVTVFLPLLARYERHSDHNVWWVAPLFYRHYTPTDSTTVGFPLYWDFKRGNDRTTIAFPFYARWRRPGHESTWAFPTIYHREGLTKVGQPDGTWRTAVFPFYDAAVKRPGDFMWEVLGGLFGHERIGRNRYLRLFFMSFELEPAQRATSFYTQPPPTPRKRAPRSLSMGAW